MIRINYYLEGNVKFKWDKELIKKYSYFLIGAVALLIMYKFIDNFGMITQSFSDAIQTIFKILRPILIGGVLAYFLFKPMRGIEKFIFKVILKSRNYPRGIRLFAILVVYIITIILVVIFFYIAIPSVLDSLVGLVNQLPGYITKINEFLGNNMGVGGVGQEIMESLKLSLDDLQNLTSRDIMDQVASYFGTNPESIMEISNVALIFVKGTVEFIISFFISFFIGLYLMLDKEKIVEQIDRFAKAVMNTKLYNGTHWVVITIDDIFYKYFTGKILTSMVIGFLYYLGLLIIGVKYAPLFAIIVGITNMIPYFGPIIGAVPGIAITLIDDPIKALWVSILIILLQQFDGNVLAPNVLGKIVELNPFWVLVSVVVGGSLFGILGMFVAIPMFAVIKVFIEEALTRWENYKEQSTLKI
jgi:predicted PurR-regulated permease PerM